MKRKIMKISSGVAIACICLLGSGCEEPAQRTCTVQQLSASGEVVDTWENAEIIRARSEWVRFRTQDGKTVVLTCPHRWIDNY